MSSVAWGASVTARRAGASSVTVRPRSSWTWMAGAPWDSRGDSARVNATIGTNVGTNVGTNASTNARINPDADVRVSFSATPAVVRTRRKVMQRLRRVGTDVEKGLRRP